MYIFNATLHSLQKPKLHIESLSSLPILRKDHYSNGLSKAVGFVVKRLNPRASLRLWAALQCAFLLLPKSLIRSEVHSEVTPSIRFLQVGALVKERATEKERRDELS